MERELSAMEGSEPMEVELADLAAILQMNQGPLVFEPIRRERQLPVSRTKSVDAPAACAGLVSTMPVGSRCSRRSSPTLITIRCVTRNRGRR
jgi:hypothetical protein